jgi:hypothetical protein
MYITDTSFSQAHDLNRASRRSARTDELREFFKTLSSGAIVGKNCRESKEQAALQCRNVSRHRGWR